MRILTLVRHAKSSWDDPSLPDFERPLNDRGRRDAPLMAKRLVNGRVRPDRLLSSPALRAITTARMFAESFGRDAGDVALDSRIYEASPRVLLDLIHDQRDDDREVMLFGHNPGISDVAHELAHCPFDEMPTCAAVRIEFDAKSWSEVKAGSGRVLLYEYPKKR